MFRNSWGVVICILMGLSQVDKVSAADVEVKATCSGAMDFYADGVLLGSHNDKTTTNTFTITDSTQVVGIKCVADANSSPRGGVMAQFKIEYDGDYQTDNTWRCSNTQTTGWANSTFNDNEWSYAETSGDNSVSANGLSPITSLKNFNKWIWTSDYDTSTGDSTVYCRGYPQTPETYDSYGRKFVIGFMENRINTYERKDISLLFTTLLPTDVSVRLSTPLITSGSLHVDDWLTIKAGEVKTYVLPQDLRHYDTDLKNYGLLVTATDRVKIIGMNQERYSTDMVLMLPLTSLGTESTSNTYFAACWDDSSDCRVVMMAGYDNTVVTVRSQESFDVFSSTRSANSDYTFTLTGKYSSVQIQASSGFTGTKIVSSKPLIVYSGNRKAIVSGTGSTTSSDHLVEQLAPSRTWGKKFVLTPMYYNSDKTKGRTGAELEKYKYVAGESSATVTVKNYNTGGSLSTTQTFTISAGSYRDVTHPRETYAVVESTEGIQVVQFATTVARYGGCLGDPWMQLIPPIAEFSRDYGVITPALVIDTDCPPQHFVTIIVDTNEKSGITVNNEALDWLNDGVDIATTNYSYITHNIAYNATSGYRIQHSKTHISFGLYYFGYGSMDSYATMGGSRTWPINLPCTVSDGTMGDGMDNDCDGLIDEDACSTTNDPTKDCAYPPPINGGWSTWVMSGECQCSGTSTSGTQLYNRQCNNPVPQFYGWPCTGDKTKQESCTCVHGQWSAWSEVGNCSCPAGTSDGLQAYDRSCTNPAPSNGGNDCDTSVHGTAKNESCNCPLDGGWTNYTAYSSCSVTCGPGNKTRIRTCTNPTPVYGGANCTGNSSETDSCQDMYCPVDGEWSSWTTGSCVCDSGTSGQQTYTRTCSNPVPQYNGLDCNSTVYGATKDESCTCLGTSDAGQQTGSSVVAGAAGALGAVAAVAVVATVATVAGKKLLGGARKKSDDEEDLDGDFEGIPNASAPVDTTMTVSHA